MKRFGRLAIGLGLGLVLLLGYLPTWCRPHVEGRVVNADAPVEGATVWLARDGRSQGEECTTGRDGRFALTARAGTGPYDVMVRFPRLGTTAPGAVSIDTSCRQTVQVVIDAATTPLTAGR